MCAVPSFQRYPVQPRPCPRITLSSFSGRFLVPTTEKWPENELALDRYGRVNRSGGQRV